MSGKSDESKEGGDPLGLTWFELGGGFNCHDAAFDTRRIWTASLFTVRNFGSILYACLSF